MALTVAVTGPTGEIGTSVVRALEQERRVDRVLGMARRPFDPASRGWRKTEYRQGDVLDPAAVAAFVAEADVVVHLAYVIVGSREESQRINLAGTRNVFEATVSADRPRRLVYTSSLAAYGYHVDNPVPLTEDVPARGSPEHYYSAQKAACEALLAEGTAGARPRTRPPCASRPWCALPADPPRRRRHRGLRGGRRHRAAGRLQPRRGRRDHDGRVCPRLGRLRDPGPRRAGRPDLDAGGEASLASCRDGVGAHRAAPDAHGHDEGPPRARLGAGAHRSRDPDRHGRRRAGQGHSVSAMPHRVPCLADGARRDVRVA